MTIKTALVVDDSPSARLVMTKLLQRLDYEVEQAESGEQALAYLQAYRPDVVFMDNDMRGLDGLETTLEIASAANTSDVPVILMTTSLTDEFISRAKAHGAFTAINKDADLETLTMLLESLPPLKDRRAKVLRPAASRRRPVAVPPPDRTPMSTPELADITDTVREEIKRQMNIAISGAWQDAEASVMQDIPQLIQRVRPTIETAIREMTEQVLLDTLEAHVQEVMADYAQEIAQTVVRSVATLQRETPPAASSQPDARGSSEKAG